ncbi:MAG TPA: LysE family translocator [Bacteroidia bacterium]|nr:LysE family translocator [Bacteroidia bacterium]HNT79786.1 LysE family translocator [Bacteroidia bacterium]
MLNTVATGAALGFALSFMIGPVFFLILAISVRQGPLAGIVFAAGVLLSDAVYIILVAVGLSQLFESNWFVQYGSYLGSTLLLVYGISILFKKNTRVENTESDELIPTRPVINFSKGFVMNMINPFVPLFWIGVSAGISSYEYTSNDKFLFYLSALVVVFLTDSTKAYLASKLSRVITAQILILFNRLAAIALILFGLRMLFYGIS